jgi:error-prone DNA polymerase
MAGHGLARRASVGRASVGRASVGRARGDFVHLHVASWYSPRYGSASPAVLAEAAAALGMPALALTDRDGVYGAYKHAKACAAVGIAVILGADLAARDGTRVTVLAAGRQGWAALCRLIGAGAGAGPDAGTGIGVGAAVGAGSGLVVMLGPDSDVGRAIAARRHGLAEEALRRWRNETSAEFVVEITDHRGPGDTARAKRLLQFAYATGTTPVLTNAVRYLDPADSPLAQVLDAARAGVPLGTPGLPTHNGRAHLAAPAEMAAIAARITPDPGRLLRDTLELAARCHLDPEADLGIGARHLPDIAGDLRATCERALGTGYPGIGYPGTGYPGTGYPGTGYRGRREEARRRLDHELDIIAATDLAPYFLTVADVTRRIKAKGIRCAIRGSGAGSLVNHLLGISAIDPLEHGLLMERFLSPTRETMPDIDLDVESARRIEAYRIILEAYGEDSTATVCMIQTYRARSAIREVAAALGLPRTEIDSIAKAFPHIRAAHIGAALTELPELRHSNLNIKQLTGIFRLAERLDGLPRLAAMHPCGVLLSDATLRDRTPVTRSSADDLPLSQLDKDDAETAGVIKLDVLGVRMQSAMACTLSRIADPPDLDAIPRDDEPTFELIRAARTIGCFQIESPGQRELVTKVAPRNIGDLIAEISLFRPGPVNSDMITPFLDIRHGRRPQVYPHESLRGALAETGGVVIFHEQVLRIIDTMAGCGLAEADRVRRRLPDEQEWFRAAARDRGYDEPTVRRVWEVLAAFGSFGFCKAHAAAFSLAVYQSAWLKRHHPAAFYVGVLTHDPGMYPKRVIISDARRAGVGVSLPDINTAKGSWSITDGGSPPAPVSSLQQALVPSLREIKGISEAEVTQIVAGQPYLSLRDFWERARVSRPVAERLVLVGAFDSLYRSAVPRPTRRDLLARLGILDRAGSGPAGAGSDPVEALVLDLPGEGFADLVPAGQLRELDLAERVAAELDILGFDVSQHVLSFYTELLDGLGVVRADGLSRCRPGSIVLVAGVKVAMQTPAIRSGKRIVFASLDDGTGLVDLAFFDSVPDRCAATLSGSWLLLVRGRLRGAPGAAPVSSAGAVTVAAIDCWDLTELSAACDGRRSDDGGLATVRGSTRPAPAAHRGGRPLTYANGFMLSPYAETGAPGPSVKQNRPVWQPPREDPRGKSTRDEEPGQTR